MSEPRRRGPLRRLYNAYDRADEVAEGVAGDSRVQDVIARYDALNARAAPELRERVANIMHSIRLDPRQKATALATLGPLGAAAASMLESNAQFVGDLVQDPGRAAAGEVGAMGSMARDVIDPRRWAENPAAPIVGAAGLTMTALGARGAARAMRRSRDQALDALPMPEGVPRSRRHAFVESFTGGRPSRGRRAGAEEVAVNRSQRVQNQFDGPNAPSPLPDSEAYRRRALGQYNARSRDRLLEGERLVPASSTSPDNTGLSRRMSVRPPDDPGRIANPQQFNGGAPQIRGDYTVAGRNLISERGRFADPATRLGLEPGTPISRSQYRRATRQPASAAQINRLNEATDRVIETAPARFSPARRNGPVRTNFEREGSLTPAEPAILRGERDVLAPASSAAEGVRRRIGQVASPTNMAGAATATGGTLAFDAALVSPNQFAIEDPEGQDISPIERLWGRDIEGPQDVNERLEARSNYDADEDYERNFGFRAADYARSGPIGGALFQEGLLTEQQGYSLDMFGADIAHAEAGNDQAGMRVDAILAELTPEEQITLEGLMNGDGTTLSLNEDATSVDDQQIYTLDNPVVLDVLDRMEERYLLEESDQRAPIIDRQRHLPPREMDLPRGFMSEERDPSSELNHGKPAPPSPADGEYDGSPVLGDRVAEPRDMQASLNRALRGAGLSNARIATDNRIGPETMDAIRQLERIWDEDLTSGLIDEYGQPIEAGVQRVKDRADRMVDMPRVREVQRMFTEGGYDMGPIDDIPGPLTLQGLNQVRADLGLDPLESLPPQRDLEAWERLLRPMLGDPRQRS